MSTIKGEARSADEKFAAAIVDGYRDAFEKAGDDGERCRRRDRGSEVQRAAVLPSVQLADNEPVLVHAKRAAESIGLKPTTLFSNGGLDANWLVKHGVPTVTIGAASTRSTRSRSMWTCPNSPEGCRLAVALATLEG